MMHFAMIRHGKGLNMCFFDGSARNLKVRHLYSLRWSQNYDPDSPTVGNVVASLPGWMK
jgi:prepilin-type processing-associated H-X9-DG protein